MRVPSKPLPAIDPESAPFWAAGREGRLLIQRCPDCGKAIFYPRAVCPECMGTPVWVEASGRGTVYTFSIARRPAGPAFAADVPYVVALVDLDEGPRMMSNVIGCPVDQVRIGMRVRVVFEQASDEVHLPRFRPDESR